MRKWVTLLMTLLVGAASQGNASTGDVDFEAGYRHDTIEWKHRFPSSDPVLESREKFKDLDIFQIGINGRGTLGCNLYLRGSAYLGFILDGKLSEEQKAYQGNSYSYSGSGQFASGFSLSGDDVIDDKYVYGASAGIGYPFYFCDCSFAVAPVVGYSVDVQDIHYDGMGLTEYSGCGGCCKHKFKNRWYGPFVGVDFLYNPYCETWNVWAELEYHFGDFKGNRGNFPGIDPLNTGSRRSHNVDAWVFGFGGDYRVCDDWTVGMSFKYQDWRARKHSRVGSFNYSDSGYAFVGSGGYGERQRIKHSWSSYAINLTAGYHY